MEGTSSDVILHGSNGVMAYNHKSPSEQFMSIVTDDILREILLRLPHVKHVIRCSLVSKRWFSLVDHPQFTAFRQSRRQTESKSLQLFFGMGFRWPYTTSSLHWLYSENESETSKIYPNLRSRGQCPELVLRSSSLDLLVFNHPFDPEIHVCNPFTWEWLKISGPERQCDNVGILVDHQNFGRYNIVLLSNFRPIVDGRSCWQRFHIFCSRTRVWTMRTYLVPYPSYMIRNPVSSRRVLYFPLSHSSELVGFFICSPDESSLCRFIPAPVEGFLRSASTDNLFFGLFSGRLRVSHLIKRKRVFSLKIWELSYDDESGVESNSSWLLVHNVRLRSAKNTKLFVAAFHPSDGDVIFMLRDSLKICRYHIGRGDKYEIVGQLPIPNLQLLNDKQNDLGRYVKAFTVFHTSWPTPLGPQLS